MENRIKEKILGGNYDLVFYCGFYLFLYGQGECRRIPYVVDVIDSFSLYTKTALMKKGQVLEKPWLALNYLWAMRYEKIHFSKAKNMIFVSPVDKAFVQRRCRHSKIWVVENGVDTEYFSERSGAKEESNALLFTGVMSYQPNIDAVKYFAREILPLIRRDVPGVQLIVAGKEPGNELRDLAKEIPGIELTGYLNDIRDAFERASVYVAPIITGAGIKNKVLEAWAMKKAVVGTSMAFYGIEVKNGDNAIVADKPKDFAKGVVKLIGDEDLRIRLGAAGRDTVRRGYSWEKQGARLIEIFTEVMNQRKAA